MPFDDDFEPDAGSDFEPDFVPDARDIRPLAKQRLDRLKNDALPWSPNTSGPVGQLTPELNTVFDAAAGANDKLDQFAQGQVDTKRRLQQEREAALRQGNITGQDPRLAAIPTPKPRSGLEPLFDRRPTPEGYDPEQDKPGALTAIAATVRAALGGAGAISPGATPVARARLRPTAPQVEPGGGVRLPPQPEPAPPIPMRMPPDLRSKAAERLAALRAQEPQAPNAQPLFAGKGLGEAPETTYFAPGDTLLGRAGASAPAQAYRGASEWMHGASADFGRWATESPDSALARVIDAGQRSDSDLAQLAAGVTKGGVQVAAEVAPTVAEFAAANMLVPGGGIGAAVHAGTMAYFAKDGVEMLTQAAKDAPGVMERGDPDEIGRALANTAMAAGMVAPVFGAKHLRDHHTLLREHPELSRDSPQLQADVADYTSARSVNNRGMDAALAALRAERQAASTAPPPAAVEQPIAPPPPNPAAVVDPAQLASNLAVAEKMLAEPDLAPEIKAKVGAVAEKIRAQLASVQPAEVPQNAPSGAEQSGMQPASFPVPPDVKLGLAQRLVAQRAAQEGVDAGPTPLQPPPAASRPAEPVPAGPAPAEVQPEPVGRPAVAPADGVAEAVARRLYGNEAIPASVDFVRRVLAGEAPPTADPKFVAKILAAAKKVAPTAAKPAPPAVAPADERLAPEPKEQLDAQLAAVKPLPDGSPGSKPGVFYPVQNGHEVPDTPPGLARVNGEQGSLIFDPRRVPVEKAQRAVDTGENLHEVIGMSGPREGVTDPEPGMVRLYRMGAPGEHEGRPPTKKADWIEQDPRYQATLGASGRWFTDDLSEAKWYEQEHPEGQLYYVDVPTADVAKYRVNGPRGSKDTPNNPAAYSLRPEKELFLPPDVAARKRPFAEAVAVTTRDARGVPITDEQTADVPRAVAAATPPEGGSVEVRPLAAVIEERKATGTLEGLAARVARQKAEAASEGPKTTADGLKTIAQSEFYGPGERATDQPIQYAEARLRTEAGPITARQRKAFGGGGMMPLRGTSLIRVDLVDQHGRTVDSRSFGSGKEARAAAEKLVRKLSPEIGLAERQRLRTEKKARAEREARRAGVDRAFLERVFTEMGGKPGMEVVSGPDSASKSLIRDVLADATHSNSRVENIPAVKEAIERVRAADRTTQAPVEPVEAEAPRERLVREAKDAGMGTPEQVDAVAQVWDARAKQWAKETGQSVGQFFQKFFGGVKKGGAPKGSLRQGEAPVFYSKLRRVIEGMKSPVTPEQLRGYLKAQGVKAEEMEWTNLDSALEGKRLVRPEELLKHLDANEVKLEEVHKGGNEEAISAARQKSRDASERRDDLSEAENRASKSMARLDQSARERGIRELMASGIGKLDATDSVGDWRESIHPDDPSKYRVFGVKQTESGRADFMRGPTRVEPSREMMDAEVAHARAKEEWRQLRKDLAGAKEDAELAADKLYELQGSVTKYHEYQTAGGGGGYRELLLTIPENKGLYIGPHFKEGNIVAHVRLNSRDGGKTLHVEEIQSDWHQAGKKTGYEGDGKYQWRQWAKENGLDPSTTSLAILDRKGAPQDVRDSFVAESREVRGVPVPNAPFKKTWPELALKRMLRYAAENGYERVTWTTGETQAERYDLAKQLDEVAYTLDKSTGRYEITGIKDMRDVFRRKGLAPAELDDVVGKDLAAKMRAGEHTGGMAHLDNEYETSGVFRDIDLKVGGEGMKGFYDKILPSVANGLAKKFGTRVGEHTIEGDVKVHSLEVTQAMRDSVMEGQPLFQKAKGAVSFMEDGKAVIHALEQPDVSTFIHETAHVFRRTLADADRAIAERVYDVKDGEWKRAHEERWATDFEHYTMTGKAPTTALARVFEQFKQWLTDIYKGVKGADIHPEIRALFDRMLGAEEARPETLVERKRRMEAEMQATNADLRGLDGLKAIIKEVDPATKLRLLQKAIPDAGPRTKQWALDELERVRRAEEAPAPGGAPDLAPTPERKANVRADELVSKVLGDNIGAMRRQAAMGAIDELVAGRPATKGVFTLPEENAIRSELGLPARKLTVKKGGVAVAPLPGAKSLGAGAGGSDMTSPLGHGFLGRALDSAKAVGRGVVQGVAKFKGKDTPGASVDIGDPVDANPTPRGVPNTLPDSVATTGGAKRNISNLAEARNLFGGGQQNTINVESPEAATALRMAAVHTAAARTVHQETMKKMEASARTDLRKAGLKGNELVTAARDRVYDTLRWLSGSNQEGLHQRWIDLKESAGKLNDKDFLDAARDSEIKTPIEALSQKKWLFEDYADERLATALAKAVKEKDAKRAREIVDDAYGRAIEAHREQTFSDPNATMDSIEAEPWLKPMLEAWDNGTGKLLEQVHRSNEGIFRQEKYLGRAKRYFPGIEAEAPTKAGGIRRPEHANQTNPDNKFATGISETGYSIAPEDIVRSASRSLFVNGRAAAEQALLAAGVSYDLPPGAEHPKTMLYRGREVEAKVEPTQTLWKMTRDGKLEQAVDLKYRVYPAQIHREMSPIFAPGVHDPHTFLKRVVDNINSAQMAGLTDLSAHVTNQILTLFNNATPIFMYAHKKASSAEQGNYVGNLLKAMWADLDSPQVQARMREMAMNGQLHPATGASTFYTDQADFLGIHDAVKPFGKEWLNLFPVDPKTGKRSLKLLPADLGPLLTGTGRGMDLALDTRIRVLLDQVGEHIFESTNPGKKWADNPQLRFDFTKQLGVYHRGLEGRLIEFMKDVPIFGRLAPFATAGTTFNRNGIAALFGGTFEMPVGEGMKAQVLNRYRAYGIAAGIAAPVATWVLLYKQHTGKYPWEDERSKFMQIPINDETRKSAFGRQLWGDDMTKTAYLNLGKYTPFTRGMRVTGARNFNPLDKAKEGLDTKDRALMAFTDIINGWLHPWTGPAVGMASVASSGFEPRFQYSPKVGRPALSPAYRGKWTPGKNLKASVLHGNPMVANYHRAKLDDRTTFGSVVDSVASGLLQNSRTPASKMEKLLSQRTPLVTKEMSDEKLAEYDYIRKTTAALRHGEDKEKVMADLREKVKAGFIGRGKADKIVEAAAMPDWFDDFEGANVEDAADAWLVATPEQRKRLGGIMSKKVKHWQGLATQKNLSKVDRDRIKAKIQKAAAAQ